MSTSLGEPNLVAILCFFAFVAVTLFITWWAARRTQSTEHFYAAGRSVTRPASSAISRISNPVRPWCTRSMAWAVSSVWRPCQ